MSRELRLKLSFIHIDGNKPTGEMAKRVPYAAGVEVLDEASCPPIIKAMIRLERLGVPNVRCHQEEPD